MTRASDDAGRTAEPSHSGSVCARSQSCTQRRDSPQYQSQHTPFAKKRALQVDGSHVGRSKQRAAQASNTTLFVTPACLVLRLSPRASQIAQRLTAGVFARGLPR